MALCADSNISRRLAFAVGFRYGVDGVTISDSASAGDRERVKCSAVLR